MIENTNVDPNKLIPQISNQPNHNYIGNPYVNSQVPQNNKIVPNYRNNLIIPNYRIQNFSLSYIPSPLGGGIIIKMPNTIQNKPKENFQSSANDNTNCNLNWFTFNQSCLCRWVIVIPIVCIILYLIWIGIVNSTGGLHYDYYSYY